MALKHVGEGFFTNILNSSKSIPGSEHEGVKHCDPLVEVAEALIVPYIAGGRDSS